jgi:lactoylglutathione lyase
MLKKLYAVCLLVKDFDISLNFYKNILALKLNSRDGKYADFKLNGTLLGIFQKDDAVVMFPSKHMTSGGGVVLAFQTKDIDKTCKELENKGIKIFAGPKTTPWGQKVAYFKDPDNHIWEITT